MVSGRHSPPRPHRVGATEGESDECRVREERLEDAAAEILECEPNHALTLARSVHPVNEPRLTNLDLTVSDAPFHASKNGQSARTRICGGQRGETDNTKTDPQGREDKDRAQTGQEDTGAQTRSNENRKKSQDREEKDRHAVGRVSQAPRAEAAAQAVHAVQSGNARARHGCRRRCVSG